jgi:hypothetical protein
MRHFAIPECDHGDVSVAIRVARNDDLALGRVFENDRGGRIRAVHAQVVAAVEGKRGAVSSVELDEAVTADDVPRVVRDRNDEVEDDVFGEKVEEVVSVYETPEALFDDAEERVQSTKVFNVLYQFQSSASLGPG